MRCAAAWHGEETADFSAEELSNPTDSRTPIERAPSRLPDPERPPRFANTEAGANAALAEVMGEAPPRFHRYPREVVARPVTLPQGVMRFDSNVGASVLGSNLLMSATFGVAAGLHDDFEIGGIPIGWVAPFDFPDPYFYVRGRFLAGELQLSGRLDLIAPAHDLNTQIGGAFELAWRAADIFRLHVDVDYQGVISNPYFQRIGVPVRAILQLGINAIELTSGVFVFNDFDDVDVPLLLAWTVSLRGIHQGPLADLTLHGGVTDLLSANQSWRVGGKISFFAYL